MYASSRYNQTRFARSQIETLAGNLVEDYFEVDAYISYEIFTPVSQTRQVSDKLTVTQSIATNHTAVYTITDTLILSQEFDIDLPSIVLTTRSGGYIEVKAAELLLTEDLNLKNRFKVASYYTYIAADTKEKLKEFKHFLNYYRNEPIYINNYTGIFEAKLDFSECTRRSMDMFKDDPTMILSFHAVKVG